MKVVVDDKIPYIREALHTMGVEALYVAGSDITSAMVRDADALIVRTRTHCDASLLEGSRVRFIATATIGYDHIDTAYCDSRGIRWTNAPGCNAASVCQYIQSVLLLLQRDRELQLSGTTLGIVGVGHVGTLVAQMARSWGMRVLLCDPPRAERGEEGFVSLDVIAREADVITLHTPLTQGGRYPTYHLADASFFASLQRKPYFINTSRGETTDTEALRQALDEGKISQCIIDVWEHEPDIDLELLERCYIGTPHIAGYSADGKANATRMSLESLAAHFGLGPVPVIVPPAPAQAIIYAGSRAEAMLSTYDPLTDSEALKSEPARFEYLRGHYPLRREEQGYDFRVSIPDV
ncbi:MAG: 4-phosphoerythronate dehydrogenase PdxB [Bacteroidaceae bacterium]|nr:4-phosphoerythronate dehydrogenase PdxB [Bacteroidaceae bacterium]